ncbi:hypothetical protein PHBOTO_006162 [Pseudozyma hubeiensis]|nr:hypothetical protein PHBOTO_006162 [Pseudozyma hubeiensis]
MESQLNFPGGFIQPVFGYHPDYTNLIENHVRNPDTRYVRVAPELGYGEIYATPWTVVRPGETEPKRGFLMINFSRNRYSPMIHTGFREEPLPGGRENAWEYINRVATVTPEEIRQRFGEVRFIGLP